MKTIQELADTSTSYNTDLLAKRWLEKIVDAARKQMFFMDSVQQFDVPAGNKDIVVPYKHGYFSTLGTSVSDQTSEGSAVTFTEMDNLKGVTLTPTIHGYGIAISNQAIRATAANLMQSAREELTDYWADVVDTAIAAAINGAAVATSSAKGASELFGGDASSTATLAAGDILTPSMISKAKTRLKGTTMYYWDTTEKQSSQTKSPWMPAPNSPFVQYIGAEQEYVLLTDSQFTNAAEYGSNEIVLNGEIGNYQGVKIITSANTTADATWGSGGSLSGHDCYMVKAGVCGAVAWGQRPRLRVFEYPSELETRLILEQAYAVDSVHDDSICHIEVLDE